ncbi:MULTISPECIES: 5-oxoprolinase subunit PxpB [Paenibacillus]|uniref:5-oxoprolinase subunit PxpB n=1 Tax=Paenibacillus TaxID=44249 RepID=UPI00203E329F|nr:5-oxoprolinase subunit PxpB [Paenibacillus camelliae]MCM3635034.1 5-oxoprolinase subunit PxpB [Paenibacillus camelliae]
MKAEIMALGEKSIIITLGDDIDEQTHNRVVHLLAELEGHKLQGVIEYVPAYCTITVHYDPWHIWKWARSNNMQLSSPRVWLQKQLEAIIEPYIEGKNEESSNSRGRIVEIPVCYGGSYGPDLVDVARHNELTPEEVIAIHSSGTYLVHMLGFAPGFPYLGGMNKAIAMPRKAIPRASIEAGSVGIAGAQTGIYPISTPGGWRIIGRTPLKLFHPEFEIPTLIETGDRIKFIPITHEQFASIGELHWT